MWRQARKTALTGHLTGYTLLLDFPAYGTGRNKCVLFKPASLWSFVTEAQADWSTRFVWAFRLLFTHLGLPQVQALNMYFPGFFTDAHQRKSHSSSFLGSTWLRDFSELLAQAQMKMSTSSWQNPGCKAQPLPWAPLPPENIPLLWKRILSPCYLHAKVIYWSMYRVNEVVWLMDTNRYCFFDLQNEFHRDWLKLKYANAQWTSCLFISVYACRPISNFFLFSFRILNGSNIF